jgi:hypothetical protein
MMCPAIDNPASCEIRAVIRFLHAKSISAAELHRELCSVYGHNVTSEVTVRQWCRMFKDGEQMFTTKGEVVDLPSVLSDDLVQSERQRFTITELSCEFPHISHTVLCEIIPVRLGYHKFWARCVPKMLMGTHKRQKIGSALIFRVIPVTWGHTVA